MYVTLQFACISSVLRKPPVQDRAAGATRYLVEGRKHWFVYPRTACHKIGLDEFGCQDRMVGYKATKEARLAINSKKCCRSE